MEIKMDEEKLKKILKMFYKKRKNIDCSINIKLDIDNDYRGSTVDVYVIQERKINLAGEEFKITRNIKIEEIRLALAELLKEEGYDITNIYYNTEVKQVETGWGCNADYHDEAVLNGLTVEAKEVEKAKTYIKE